MTMRISQLLQGVAGVQIAAGSADLAVGEVRDDSRLVQPGDLFVAVPGSKQDGRRFIEDALAKGAAAVLTEAADGARVAGRAALILVPSARLALGQVAANRFAAGARLTLTAVTGTNGKTTTTYLVEGIFKAAGRQPGVIGTVGYRFGNQVQAAPLTTPGALHLHQLFAGMRDGGCTDVVLEASSIALEQGRLHGCRFRVAALSNVTQDHLDYHGSMERYFDCKAILFRELMLPTGVSVLFADDEHGRSMRRHVRGSLLTLTHAARGADVAVRDKQMGPDGIRVTLDSPVGAIQIASPLVGEFNLSNLLLATGMGLAHGIEGQAIAQGLAGVRGVPGRLERVPNRAGVLCVVDYAHTPDALERALDVLRPLTRGRLIVVFGCGGDRDKSKRPLMGRAAAERGDVVVVTSDNPRTEEPGSILQMIVEGVNRAGLGEKRAADLRDEGRGFCVEEDRHAAIELAVSMARAGDTLLIAGKGHEDYQILGARKIHFDDREVAAAVFAR